ncbi:hypothetical protein HBI56_199760 [Parastagonospora nodorum]|nr:hypothetical protein HBH52_213760 [Parastagonospora nodorum]KAH3992917.1 hypothetical protein HBI10_209210 [Parastagonospora nodorum]KAH4010761.1 hypothetical protein HBI13_206990 [Parastagonospora nodorum]KAH4042846.1 hypothetical protein HBH49_243630 [Parastagonospora nodorum]KAH4083966.1 hypothetical protein HBH46_215320 [Parastagonospora nodorum]
MPGKRRRTEDVAAAPPSAGAPASSGKPLSAIAAARLRAEAAVTSLAVPQAVPELGPVPEPVTSLPQSPIVEHEESEQEDEPLPLQQNVKLCTWRNEAQNIISDTPKELTVKLSKHTTISLVGCFQFRVLRGAIHVNGANIGAVSRDGQQDQIYTAHVPATHPISKFRGLDGMNHVQFLHCANSTPLAETASLFADVWNVPTGARGSRSFRVITDSDADPLARPLISESCPEDWLRAVEECAADPSVVVAVGASASGKSTFVRRLLNRYLTGQGKAARSLPAVCYLDLDPSKPEYTPHGQISLIVVRSLNLEPNFMHPATPLSQSGPALNETIRSHCVPANPANYQDYFRACTEDLFLAYSALRSQDPLLPMIVNTAGSLYMSDFSLLMALIARFKPHYAVHLGDTRTIDVEQATKLHSLQTIVSQYRGTVHEVTAYIPAPRSMRTDSELRAMHMQSYFHLTKTRSSEPMWNSSSMSELVPWEFCFDDTDERMQDFVGFATYSEPVDSASLFPALNGSIVQIVESTSSAIPTPYTALPRTKRYRIPHFDKSDRTGMVEPLDPRTSKMVCTALVRGFDMERNTVQVLVPASHESLMYNLSPERTVLVSGCCDPPEWAYLEDVHSVLGSSSSERRPSGSAESVPWVENGARVEDMGYLSTVRRVRKFQT